MLMPNSKYESEVKIDTAAMQDYYNKNKAMFRTPAKKSFAYMIFDPIQIAATIQVSDAELRRQYQSNLDKFRVPERAQARHILLMTDEKKNNDAEVKAKAEDVLKQLRGGRGFRRDGEEVFRRSGFGLRRVETWAGCARARW